MLVPYPPLSGGRIGAKDLLVDKPVRLALDYGGALYLTNVPADMDLLASVPLGDVEVYGGLRGFGSLSIRGTANPAAALPLAALFLHITTG